MHGASVHSNLHMFVHACVPNVRTFVHASVHVHAGVQACSTCLSAALCVGPKTKDSAPASTHLCISILASRTMADPFTDVDNITNPEQHIIPKCVEGAYLPANPPSNPPLNLGVGDACPSADQTQTHNQPNAATTASPNLQQHTTWHRPEHETTEGVGITAHPAREPFTRVIGRSPPRRPKQR